MKIQIILPISRTDYLKPVFDCLNALERPEDTELLIITDGDSELEKAVDRRLDSINYKGIVVSSFGDTAAQTINNRRFRISDIHNYAREFILPEATHVFLIEDDTTYPANTLTKFLKTFDTHTFCGYVEGVELGRWATPYVGGWKADDIENPKRITSVMPHGKDLELIDAGGFYCCLVKADLYREHRFRPFDAVGRNGLSCDVNLGMHIRNQGYLCYIDWSIQCDHIGEKGSVNLGNTKPRQVVFEKVTIGKWEARTV